MALTGKTDERRQAAVSGALALFWERGAETASYDQIVAATGLSRKALYGLWPEKSSLITETIATYRTDFLGQMIAPLWQPGRAGLEVFWQGLETAMRTPGWRGCYLFRSASGPLRDMPDIALTFADYLSQLQNLLEGAIRTASKEGLLPTAKPEVAALQVVGLICAMSTIGAQRGFDPLALQMLGAARLSCGLSERS